VNDIEIVRLEADSERPDFDCGDNDLNEYFKKDSRDACLELMAVTYAVYKGDEIVAFFGVSNDSLKKEQIGKGSFRRLTSRIAHRKRYASQPAVKIGRFAVAKDQQRSGVGGKILNYVTAFFMSTSYFKKSANS
jgi:hypothetical protein